MSTNKQTGKNKQTDLVLEVTPPEVGHLKIGLMIAELCLS